MILPINSKKIRRARRSYTIANAGQHDNSNNNTSSATRALSVMEKVELKKHLGASSDELSSPPLDVSSSSDRYDQIESFVT